jgi:starvation-inducible DNA-binding protein
MAKNDQQAKVLAALSVLLANTYTLYLKTQNYHWNVTGPYFSQLHALFQTQYEDLALANDLLAERIRALGEKAPGSYSAFAKLSSIKEENGNPAAMQMVKNLAKDHETLSASAEVLIKAAEAAGDEPSLDMAIQRMDVHQKTHWMLAAHLE